MLNRCRVSVWNDEKMLLTINTDGHTTLQMYLMPVNGMLGNG